MNRGILFWRRQLAILCLIMVAATRTLAQSTQTSGGWFVRGSGTNFTDYSLLIPLDGEAGVASAPSLATTYTNLGRTALYHLNAASTGSQNVLTNRIAITNAVAAFGSKYGGSPLYFGKDYRIGAYAGDFSPASNQAILVTLVNRTNGVWVGYMGPYGLPIPSETNQWNTNLTEGLTTSFNIAGLTSSVGLTISCYADWQSGAWGVNGNGDMILKLSANTNAVNCEYTIWLLGAAGTNWMVLDNTGSLFFSPLCTVDFDPQPPLQPNFVSQPQFSGKLLPPFYEGKSLTELLAVRAAVTNAVNNAATNWLDLDDSPELRDHPTLDQFVTDMGSNALALTSYVFNNIELTDDIAYNSNTNALLDTSVNLGGVNRSAYATFMEGQGSPTEQCALLVYLLRRAGVPAAFIFGPADGIQMLDTELSSLLRMQVHGAVDQNDGQVYTTNTLISVNYPWVAAYVNGQWVHLFPWLKNTEVTEGLNAYDYLPAGYNSGYLWVNQYLGGDTNILGLSTESDVPSTLFPLFVQEWLLTNAPGVSLNDIGTTAVDRPVEFNHWSDFPTPFAVTNAAVTTVHDLTTITTNSGFSSWTNIWDTISVQVYSSNAPSKSLYTGDLRMADLQDRKFLIRQQTNTTSGYTLTLSLAPYQPTATNVFGFTNDVALTNQETMTMTLATTDDTLDIVYSRKRHRLEPPAVTNVNYWSSYLGVHELLQITNTSTMRLGDLAAICLHSGKVSQQMLTPWAQEYWTMQQEVAANPALTNTISPDITRGTLPYLMGMSYFERCSRFQEYLAQLHKVQLGTVVGQGLSILGAERTNTGALMLPINLYHPHVDMTEDIVTYFGNASLRPDEGADEYSVQDSFLRLYVTEASAQEHKITEDFYSQVGGISSVRLLREAGLANAVELDNENYLNYASQISPYDPAIWQAVVNAFTAPTNVIATVYITKQPVTNTTVGYAGMGALIYSPTFYAALISGNGMPANGGWGDPFPDPIYNPPDYSFIDLCFNTSPVDNWSVTYFAPVIAAPPPMPEIVSYWSQPVISDDLFSGSMGFDGADVAQQQAFNVAAADLGYTGPSAPAAAYADTVNNGGDYDAHLGYQYAQLASAVADPVNAVTGEFYIDATDLTLPGPMPLFIRRNYSSQDVDLGDTPFGYGWRPAYTPYLRLVTNGVIFAAELDGTVVAYRQPVAGTNFWQPMPADNPQLNNRSSVGIGSTANLFNNYITTNLLGGNTNYVLNGADGSVRLFQYLSYPITTSTNNFARTRPYLESWTDASGNSYSFAYQTDNTQPDYGQLLRVQSSNGNFLGFYYDVYAHITQAYTEDGRRLNYDYDSHGDLVTVTLPDESQINYTYQHTNSITNIVSGTVTNTVTNIYSTHLIAQEQKPDGRTLANTYDSLRRVITQAATVGDDLNLVTNALFTYSNNLTDLTNAIITGTTYIVDVFGHTNTYQYTSNQITAITDQLGQTISQVWYTNTTDPGYYPHSLKSMTDKRGLNTAYQYDASGNLAQVVLTGGLTGNGPTNETATYSFSYTNRNLIATASNPSTNEVMFTYGDSAHPTLPTSVVKLASGTPVSTNIYVYTDVSEVVTNGAVLATNSAFGLVQEAVRGGFGGDTFLYDGRGFMIQATRSTGTADPAVTTTLFYDDRGELSQRTDAAGRSLTFGYDDMGRMTEEEVFEPGSATPEGWNFLYYSENGDLVWTDGSRYNPEDYTWRDYDGAGRKITEMHWRSEANPNGSGVQTPALASNLYATTFFQYDEYNNLTQTTDPLGNYTTNGYDAIGQLTRSVAFSAAGTPLATNQYAYEPGGKVREFTNAIGGVTGKGYTFAGKLVAQTNADGSTNGWTYYLDGRLHKEFLPNGNYWETIYNDPQRTVTRYFHNGGGILATNLVVMDAHGNVIKSTDSDGNVFTNLYDGLDRIKIAAGPPVITVVNAATGIQLPTTNFVTNILQQITTYIYDTAGQTLTTSNALGETTVTTSDAMGRPTQVAIYASNSVTPVRITSTSYSADHQSVTVTNGTGASAIVTTTYTDNDGHPLLTIGYPTNGVTEFNWWQYDLAGNCLAQQQCSSNATGITIWATNGWTYDGLNRVATETSRDGATTTYGLDALGDTTSRAMPGGLTWTATYLSDGQMATEQETNGGQTARSMSYTYYSSSSPYAGMLDTVTDGRSTVKTETYDDFLRLAGVTTTGSAGQQQTTTTYKYDPRGSLTNLAQSFGSTNTGPSTSVVRHYDAYDNLVSDAVSVAGVSLSTMGQGFDPAGRRTQMGTTPFNYRADGLPIAIDGSTFGYANDGLLTGRTNAPRKYTINQRDGRGRILSTTTTTANGLSTLLTETLNWRGDGRLASYLAQRGDFNDQRYYSYSPFAQRLTQESFQVWTGNFVTNIYTIDNGATGGLGILTSQAQSGTQSDTWSVPSGGGLDGFSRVATSQDTILTRPAYGTAVGAATVSASLDGKPVAVEFDGPKSADGTWHSSLSLFPGSHTLSVSAVDPSGEFSAATNISFTAYGGATDAINNQYDGNGNVTQRVWVSSSGVTNKIQTLTYDAFDRLMSVTDRDTNSSGFNFVSIYDGLGRRVRTIQTLVTNGVAITNGFDVVNTVDSWYDPQVEFLEVAVNVNGTLTSKVYGPDASGTYGGLGGVGGLETLYINGHTTSYGSVQDVFGNILASISNSVVTWTSNRFSSYGPVPGYQPSSLSPNVSLEQVLGWRGKRVDDTGLIYLGARHYDPLAGRFTSADPMGHGASQDLYSFCGGDPVNFFDPDGRFGKQMQATGDSDSAWRDFSDSMAQQQQDANQQDIDYAPSDWQYSDEGQGDLAQWSALVDMVPVVGGLKQWYEMDTGKDAFTGQWMQGNDYLQALGVVANFLPVVAGPAAMLEGGGDSALIGAGEEGLMDVGGEAESIAAEDVGAVNAANGEEVAEEATVNPADSGAEGQTSSVASGSMNPQGVAIPQTTSSSMVDFHEATAPQGTSAAEGGGPVAFYSVQSQADAARLASGGAPWPTGLQRANLGQGLYAWGTQADAETYAANKPGSLIVKFEMSASDYSSLHTLDMRTMTDEAATEWLGKYSQYGEGKAHGFDHIIRATDAGTEYYFSPDAFQLFK
jgi:RHS repeat-associated protein